MNEKRTFGIEIEMLHNDKRSMEYALRAAGIECHAESYNHVTKKHWKIVYDGSIRGEGYELVSPILKGQEGIHEVETVCRVLNEQGAKVNKSCGLHVHHDAKDFNQRKFSNLFRLYRRSESLIDSMMPASRRGNNNRFCRSLSLLSDVNMNDRYFKVNFRAYHVHGTIEFRQHSGTVDAEKVVNWILITQRMMDRSNRKVEYGKDLSSYDFLQTLGLIHEPDGEKERITGYIKSRIESQREINRLSPLEV